MAAPRLFDTKLLGVIVVISLPFAAAAARRVFGSLGAFWKAERSTWRTPGEFGEDTAKEILLPWSRGKLDRLPFGDDRVWIFWACYAVVILAAYSIIHVHLPSVATFLTSW